VGGFTARGGLYVGLWVSIYWGEGVTVRLSLVVTLCRLNKSGGGVRRGRRGEGLVGVGPPLWLVR
jgi:hypothetical protein